MTDKATSPRWVPPRPRLAILVYALLLVLNAFDAAATLAAVERGAEELNPVMRESLALGSWHFLAIKMGMIAGFAALLVLVAVWHRRRERERKFAWRALCVLTAVYAAVFAWHVGIVIYANSLLP